MPRDAAPRVGPGTLGVTRRRRVRLSEGRVLDCTPPRNRRHDDPEEHAELAGRGRLSRPDCRARAPRPRRRPDRTTRRPSDRARARRRSRRVQPACRRPTRTSCSRWSRAWCPTATRRPTSSRRPSSRPSATSRAIAAAPFKSWLSRIAVNGAMDLQRARRRRPVQPYPELEDEAWQPPAGPEADPERRALTHERSRVLNDALAKIADDQRVADRPVRRRGLRLRRRSPR